MQLWVALTRAGKALGNAGIEESRLEAEILLTHALGVTRAQLHAHAHSQLSCTELASYRQLIERRARREPVAYMLGHKEFYGLDLLVDHRVLIPRPETELLVEKAIEISERQLGSLSSSHSPNSHLRPMIADIGTGSGAIAISLAVHLSQALQPCPGQTIVFATDASPKALEVAACNCRRHGVEDRVRLLQGHLLEPLPEPVDLILANLPYVSQAELAHLPPEISQYEPREALDGGSDGLKHIRRLLSQAGRYLKSGGIMLLEIGATQGEAVAELGERYFPAASVEIAQDYAGLDRVVVVET